MITLVRLQNPRFFAKTLIGLYLEAYQFRSSFFYNVAMSRFVVIWRRFGTTYPSHLQGPSNPRSSLWTAWPLKCCW